MIPLNQLMLSYDKPLSTLWFSTQYDCRPYLFRTISMPTFTYCTTYLAYLFILHYLLGLLIPHY